MASNHAFCSSSAVYAMFHGRAVYCVWTMQKVRIMHWVWNPRTRTKFSIWFTQQNKFLSPAQNKNMKNHPQVTRRTPTVFSLNPAAFQCRDGRSSKCHSDKAKDILLRLDAGRLPKTIQSATIPAQRYLASIKLFTSVKKTTFVLPHPTRPRWRAWCYYGGLSLFVE